MARSGRSDAPQRPTGSKGGVAERRETFWRPRDLVHILYAYKCRRRGVHGDDQTWSSIMPIIFDVLYRESRNEPPPAIAVSGAMAPNGKVAMARDGDSEQGRARHQRRREFRSGPLITVDRGDTSEVSG